MYPVDNWLYDDLDDINWIYDDLDDINWSNSALKDIAVPMVRAYASYKNGGFKYAYEK